MQKYFARPEAWDILSAQEQEELRSLLPQWTPYDAAGRPTFEFLRYDNHWRNGVRLFQEDIAAGRYEKEWIEAAEQAMKDRAEGKFDAWKEEQFEQFWGQNSHIDPAERTQQMAKVTLDAMIRDGEFQVGDVLDYAKTFGRAKNKFLLEKQVTITEILPEECAIRVEIPPGMRKTLIASPPIRDSQFAEEHEDSRQHEPVEASRAQERTHMSAKPDSHDLEVAPHDPMEPKTPNYRKQRPFSANSSPLSDPMSISPLFTPAPGRETRSKARRADLTESSSSSQVSAASPEQENGDSKVSSEHPTTSPRVGLGEENQALNFAMEVDKSLADPAKAPEDHSPLPLRKDDAEDTPIEFFFFNLPSLEHKLVEVDGRLKKWDGRGGNQWRTMRCIRNGKDRGTLWQMKERYGENKGLVTPRVS